MKSCPIFGKNKARKIMKSSLIFGKNKVTKIAPEKLNYLLKIIELSIISQFLLEDNLEKNATEI